jgi:hypothetical protein
LSQRGSIRRVECLPGFVHLIEKCVLLWALEAGVDPADVREVPAKPQVVLKGFAHSVTMLHRERVAPRRTW